MVNIISSTATASSVIRNDATCNVIVPIIDVMASNYSVSLFFNLQHRHQIMMALHHFCMTESIH